jgi:hypothetical protein
MRRITTMGLALLAVLAMLAMATSSALAAPATLPAAGTPPAAQPAKSKPPKAKDYSLCDEVACGVFTIQLFKSTGQWDFEGYPEYGGTYATSGSFLELFYEDGACDGCFVYLEKGKKGSYAGDAYDSEGEFIEEWLLTKEK